MFAAIIEEEMKLDAMQRVWQTNFRSPGALVFEEAQEITPFVNESPQEVEKPLPNNILSNSTLDYEPIATSTFQVPFKTKSLKKPLKPNHLILNASDNGDFPAQYTITPVEGHQFPTVGVYIDKRILPGFKYRVRPLSALGGSSEQKKCLFGGQGLVLKSIGRGYSRRFTFENEKYFWSDNRPEGFAFELEVVSKGDKFTVFDVNREAQGTAEIVEIEEKQVEIGTAVGVEAIEKRVKVTMTAKVEFYETGVAQMMPVSGIAICVKKPGQDRALIKKIINVNIKHHRYYFTPGFKNAFRRVTVQGIDINDLPTKYTMTGLQPYEIPVVGTYVDPRIIPGFTYRIRPNDRKKHLFNGESLKLQSIGMGYAKRLTFGSNTKLNPSNYLWSDNHRDGLGLEPRAVLKGMKFKVLAGDQILGEATVFRDDLPQTEKFMEKELTSTGKYSITKYIQIDVICHIKLECSRLSENEQLLRVCGLAVVQKLPGNNQAKVLKVENVGLDSQLYLLFAHSQTELTFIPA
ncbi:uncharacterized protein [Onthophagus taurus]|uniref:uncharacterized protein n=1 Tax=Onthophagus taurus TaxID=166361 RepID=UPI0039BEC77F